MNTRLTYPTDLTDAEWAILEPLLPKRGIGRPRLHTERELLNGIGYVLRGGIAWRMLPHDFPSWQTVYAYFRMLNKRGGWLKMNNALREQVRLSVGREAEPSTVVVDSQSVKTAEKGGFAVTMEASRSKDANGILPLTVWDS